MVFITIFLILLSGQAEAKKTDKTSKIKMLSWEEVDQVLPRYSKFIVKDLESGKQFRVQRRAGSNHADVQPLTAKDTKIMKQIYNGKWSWKRRAIIVIHKSGRIGASMHGMPHGGGALKNNFPGHFCIHFYGSTTHATNTMDLSHMLMVYKASGKLDDYLAKANPYEVVNAYIAGFKQQDERILSMISIQNVKWGRIVPDIDSVRITRLPLLPAEDLTEEIMLDLPIEIDWYIANKGRQTFHGVIHLIRFSTMDGWKVDSMKFVQDNSLT